MNSYRRIQVITGIYLLIYIAALYFSTGVQVGFKLDSNHLTGYVSCGLLLAVIMGSEFGKRLRIKKLFSILILGSVLKLLK